MVVVVGKGERGSSQSADSGDARKADCLFVGSFWCCAHKQVETNNILAALRERADGEGGGRLRLPQGGGNEANECREPLPSLMPASGPRVPLSLPPPPLLLASFLYIVLYRFRFLRLDTIESRTIEVVYSPFCVHISRKGGERRGESCVNRRFSIGWKPELEIEECSIDVGWKLAPICGWLVGDAWRGIVWRGGVRITRFLMTNDDVSRGRFVDRRGIERVSWYWTICFSFFFF